MILALDIETDAIPALVLELPEPEVLCGNLKDPAKIAEKVAGARQKQIRKLALDPHFARVLAVALSGEPTSGHTRVRPIGSDEDGAERAIIEELWGWLARADQIYTFNGAAFDLPFLYRRSLLLGVRPCAIEIDKYRVRTFANQHVDLYQLLQQWEVGNGQGNALGYTHTQAFYAKTILDKTCPYGGLDKGALGDLHRIGQDDKILQLVQWDAQTTFELGQRLRTVYP